MLITTAHHDNFCMKVSIIFIIKMFHINQMHNYKHAEFQHFYNIFNIYVLKTYFVKITNRNIQMDCIISTHYLCLN